MFVSKFITCINKLFSLKPYFFLSNLKSVSNSKFIAIQEKIIGKEDHIRVNDAEKLFENFEFENALKVRRCKIRLSKSDIGCISKGNSNQPPTCFSVPCCNSKLSNPYGKTWDRKIQLFAEPIAKDKWSMQSRPVHTADLQKCKLAKPSTSAPSKVDQHNNKNIFLQRPEPKEDQNNNEMSLNSRSECKPAMPGATKLSTTAPSKADQHQRPEENNKMAAEFLNKIKTSISKINPSNITSEKQVCPYCTLSASIPKNYACPFCAKSVNNCTCIHCPHCKMSRISSSCKKQAQPKRKPTGKMTPANMTLQDKMTALAEKHNTTWNLKKLDSKTFPKCTVSKPKIEKLSLLKSKEKDQVLKAKSSVSTNNKMKGFSKSDQK